MVEYNDNSIEDKGVIDGVRLRPASVLGSNGIEGARHTIREIIGNALDEAASGFGDKLEVGLSEDGFITVRDYGRGIPLGWNENAQEFNWKVIFTRMYSGGKYKDSQEKLKKVTDWSTFDPSEYHYLFTIGLNGIGSFASCATAEKFEVRSYRDGEMTYVSFTQGHPDADEATVEETTQPRGTEIRWKPDGTVFDDAKITDSWLRNYVQGISAAANLDVEYTSPDGEVTLYPAQTISSVLGDTDYESTGYLTHVRADNGDVLICVSDIAFKAGSSQDFYYHNRTPMRGGVHSDGSFFAQQKFFREQANARGIKVTPEDWDKLIAVAIAAQSNKMSPRGQTKDSIDDRFVQENIEDHIYQVLISEYSRGSEWVRNAVKQCIENAENREYIKELQSQVREVERVTKSRTLPEKFVPCKAYTKKKYDEVELWLLEGDSALGSFQAARDSTFQAGFPLRGKSLNMVKADVQTILENKEIRAIMQILACGVNLGVDSVDTFDRKKLRVGKIVIGSDADIDGWHIRMLIFLIFYRLMPEILYEGLLYVAETPLYTLYTNKGIVQCYSEEEYREQSKALGGNIRKVSRYKGLGEVDAKVLKETTVSPENRKLVQIKIDKDDRSVDNAVEILFGVDTYQRKKAILTELLGNKYEEVIDELSQTLNELGTVEEDLEVISIDYS